LPVPLKGASRVLKSGASSEITVSSKCNPGNLHGKPWPKRPRGIVLITDDEVETHGRSARGLTPARIEHTVLRKTKRSSDEARHYHDKGGEEDGGCGKQHGQRRRVRYRPYRPGYRHHLRPPCRPTPQKFRRTLRIFPQIGRSQHARRTESPLPEAPDYAPGGEGSVNDPLGTGRSKDRRRAVTAWERNRCFCL
jgi:hypothetical protein